MNLNQFKHALAKQRPEQSILTQPDLDSLAGMKAGGAPVASRLAYLQGAITGTPYDDWMMFTDDSHWEPDIDYASMAPHVGTFCTRAGGPKTWTEGTYNDSPDPCWFDKHAKIRATGRSLGGYWVPNFGLMVMDWKRPAPIIDTMKQSFYGKFVPDWICIDFEIAWFYRGATKITIPPENLTLGLSYLLEAVWEEWRKTVVLYTRSSFLEEYGIMKDGTNGFRTILDNKNRGDTRFPLWLAYYPTPAYIAKELSPDPAIAKTLLPPKTLTNKRYLEFGSTNPAHIGWQFSPKMLWNGKNLDWNIFPMTRPQWEEWIGFTAPTPDPGDPGDPGPGDPLAGDYVTRTEFLNHTHGRPEGL